jgi:microcystin-dependent protein
MARLNKNLSGTQITDEIINRTSSTSLGLNHDTIMKTGFEIWTGAGGTGTQLTLTTDYTLGSEDSALSAEAGDTIYTKVAIVNGAYHSMDLYVTYKSVGDYVDVVDGFPVGGMTPYGGASAPTGWLLCDGSAVSRTTYYALFQAIGTGWGVGDGSTTFNLPDAIGAAPVGVGTSTGYTENETYALGTKYNDQMQGHHHLSRYYLQNANMGTGITIDRVNIDTDTANDDTIAKHRATSPTSDGTNGTPRTGTVTHGKRIGVNYIIKY